MLQYDARSATLRQRLKCRMIRPVVLRHNAAGPPGGALTASRGRRRPQWLHWALILGVLLLGLAMPPLASAGGVVTNCSDDAQFSGLLASGGTITFNCGGIGATAAITIASTKAIGTAVRIDGGGKITLSGNQARRIFNVQPGANLTLANLTLRDGRDFGGGAILNQGTLTIENGTLVNNEAYGQYGGAIKNIGALTVTNSLLTTNAATTGYGGAIDSAELDSLTVIVSSTLSNNSAGLGGGGIANNGIVRLTGATFSGNTASANYGGGAIENTGPLTVVASTFSGNTAGKGGGIYNRVLAE